MARMAMRAALRAAGAAERCESLRFLATDTYYAGMLDSARERRWRVRCGKKALGEDGVAW